MTTAGVAWQQGRATARNLAGHGINVDLAPVLDVGRGGFITSRAFGSSPSQVAVRGVAFIRGLLAGGVLPTAKHFPGLGYALATTDTSAVAVTASRGSLTSDFRPFQEAIAAGVPIVLVSTATYPSLGVTVPAACSPTVVKLLRGTLRFKGVLITDALDSPAVTSRFTVPNAALLAIKNGVDMVLAAGATSLDANAISNATYVRLLNAADDGQLPRSVLQTAYQRILALKSRLVEPATSASSH
jgi:beta-N-acetylhexosaminidase